jgi:hypothetical protein
MKVKIPFRQAQRLIQSRALWIFLTMAGVIAAYYFVQVLAVGRLARAEAKTTPFTMNQEFYVFDKQSPQGRLYGRMNVSRRSDGTMVRVGTLFGSVGLAVGETARNIEFPDGATYRVLDGIKAFVRYAPASEETLAVRKTMLADPPPNCVAKGDTFLDFESIQGLQVAKLAWPDLLPQRRRVTTWAAPSLGCETVQSLAQQSESDGSLQTTGELKLVSISYAEPAAALFEVPAGYLRLTPSEAMRKEAARLGVPWTSDSQQIAERQDAAYKLGWQKSSRP